MTKKHKVPFHLPPLPFFPLSPASLSLLFPLQTPPLTHCKRLTIVPLNVPGTIGITQFAASALGDVVYVELPTIDLSVSAGDSIGAVESVKSASDIMTPVTGKIVATNETLESKPSLINQGPEGEGWIARIEVGEEGKVEIGGLMGADEYKEFTEEEGAKE